MKQKPKVAFICVHNSCRSQIAEALGKPDEAFDRTIIEIEGRILQLRETLAREI